MKKLTLALVALLVVCSSIFAATTVTAGLGFGGYMIPHDFSKGDDPVIEDDRFVYNMGPVAFVGIDYVKENGLTVYGDIAANVTWKDNGKDILIQVDDPKERRIFVTATGYAGAGYTYNKDLLTLMAGAGVEAKMAAYGLNEGESFLTLGAGLRLKATYAINEKFSVSAQLNPSYDFYTKAAGFEGQKDVLETYNKFASGNLLIGVTFNI